jgi:hypothetical protein
MPYRTPGVYILEEDAFPNAVAEVATGIPAFVGYTGRAGNEEEESLHNKPVRISSLREYQKHFGGGMRPLFALQKRKKSASYPAAAAITQGNASYDLLRANQRYYLYPGIQLFFQNGGGACYIVSVGDYSAAPDKAALSAGIDTLKKETEPDLLVIPDAVLLPDLQACSEVQQKALAHCAESGRCFAILDIYNGDQPRTDAQQPGLKDCIAEFRATMNGGCPQYAAAYYPWLETALVPSAEPGHGNITGGSRGILQSILQTELANGEANNRDQQTVAYKALLGELGDSPADQQQNQTLLTLSPLFRSLIKQMTEQDSICPPSAAIAGIYTRTDNSYGVFKAPANTTLSAIIRPLVEISHEEQEDLNVPVSGQSVNAIRTFPGRGNLIWGARTLDGNSQDWRYINVRRTLIMLEQSIQRACEACVFAVNDALTRTTLNSMLEDFLHNQWQAGALAGAKASDAYHIDISSGSAMTTEDIPDGYMRVMVKVAVVRPAEFIVITFRQKMQSS